MTREQIISRLKAHEAEIRAKGVVRHRYDTASEDRIWEIITLDLRALRTTVRKIVAKHRRKT